jgi:hypothetical protein
MSPERIVDIERTLHDDLDHARAGLEEARAKFTISMHDVPSGIPGSDGVASIQRAGTEHRMALARFALALRRFNNYILNGSVPDDLG